MTYLLLILLLVVGCSPTESDDGGGENIEFSGITETNSDGDLIGNVDEDDWCEIVSTSGYDSCNDDCYTEYGLNPVYPNPIELGDYGSLFGTSYQVCYMYACPNTEEFVDSDGNPGYKVISLVIVSEENDTLYTHHDEYCWGKVGTCAYLPESSSGIYRMNISTEDEFECYGDIQLN